MDGMDEKPIIKVWKMEVEGWPDYPFPWVFNVTYKGETWEFAGIPNKCATKRQALARAVWRAKWIKEGTFDKHYA